MAPYSLGLAALIPKSGGNVVYIDLVNFLQTIIIKYPVILVKKCEKMLIWQEKWGLMSFIILT